MTNYESLYGSVDAAVETVAQYVVRATIEASPLPVSEEPDTVYRSHVDLASAVLPPIRGWVRGWLLSPSVEETVDGRLERYDGQAAGKTNYERLFGTVEAAANNIAIASVSQMKPVPLCMASGDVNYYVSLIEANFTAMRDWALKWLASPAVATDGDAGHR